MSQPEPAKERAIRLGISSCLLGQAVRFDGRHKHDRFVTDQLGRFVEWVPVCPEVEVGMGVPRPPVRLVRVGKEVRMLEVASARDYTRRMRRYAGRRVRALRALGLCGYVLKQGSPSCGPSRVEIHSGKGASRRQGRGLYASALVDRYPLLPIEDEVRLRDAGLRENFIERVFAYRRLRALFEGRWTNRRVMAFHTRHELQLMGHSPAACRRLGSLVAALKRTPRAAFRRRYEAGFMEALASVAPRARSAHVLRHVAGRLKESLAPACRAELAELIRDYRAGLVPLLVPVTLLRHHARNHAVDDLARQTFLEPDPEELMLRNHS